MSTAATSPESPTQRDSYIPVFTGQPADYREWRKRIQLYHAKMALSNRRGEAVINLVSTLTGAAWRLMEDFDVTTAEKEGTFDGILKILDQHFEYDSRVQLPADFDAYFGLSRKSGQSLMEFVTLHNEHLKRLSKHGVDLPNAVQGWHLLRRCNITKEQKQLITLRAPQLEIAKVTEALYLVLGQDYKHTTQAGFHDRRGFGKGGRGRGYVAVDAADFEEPYNYGDGWTDEWGYYEGDDGSPSYYGGDDDEWDEADEFDAQAAYYQYEETNAEPSETALQDVDTYDEVYAAYVDARRRFSDLKLARGFLPVVALNDPAAGNLAPGVTSPQLLAAPLRRARRGNQRARASLPPTVTPRAP